MPFWLGLLVLIVATCTMLTGLCRLACGRGESEGRREASAGHRPATTVWLAMGLALAAAGVLLFMLLAQAWQEQPSLAMDAWAALRARDAWSPGGRILMLGITSLGAPLTLWGLGGAIGLLLMQGREWVLLAGWSVALAGNAVWNPTLKTVYERLRPDPDLSHLVSSGYSFPSGHSSGAMVTYGMLACVAWHLLPARRRLPALWLAVALILAIGASRVYLQAHFLSDVLGGYASGGAWLAVCVAATSIWHARRQRPRN